MKNLIVILFAVLALASCKKDSIDDIYNPTASMKAKIGTAQWEAVTRLVTLQSNKFIITGTGTVAGNNVIAITVLGETTGTYNLNAPQSQLQFSANYTPKAGMSADSIYQAYEGVVTISEIDATNKKISGTFSFKMRMVTDINNEVNVTEGTFTSLSY
jgi:hypothetical protein